MTVESTQVMVWHVGVENDTGRAEHITVNEEYPAGRYTMDEAQARVWAQESADLANSDPRSGATDWQPAHWLAPLPGTNTITE